MLHWYLLNTFELVMVITFLYAAYKFIVIYNKKKIGIVCLAISLMSFGMLYLCVQASGIIA